MTPASASPRESPLQVTLNGALLLNGLPNVDDPLMLEVTERSDDQVRFRMSIRAAPPGRYWIRMESSSGSDSLPFTVESLAPGEMLEETRALWVSRFEFASEADVVEIMGKSALAGFNVVYFQVRGRADALYRSNHEPWAMRLTGTLGQDPGWDPLGVAVREAQRHRIELHAWINAFTGWAGAAPPTESMPRHVFLEHPGWAMADVNGNVMPYASGNRWLTPGHPGVRTRLAAVAADVVRNYQVDGIHLDFVRYPSNGFSYDSASIAAFDSVRAAGEPSLDFSEMRRRFVTWAVRETRDSIKAVSASSILSAAVWGVFDNSRSWNSVSTGYDGVLQDAREWDRLGIVDALVPMVYWPIGDFYGDRLDFAFLSDDHASALGGPAYIGIYVPSTQGAGLARHVERAMLAGADGVSVFSYSSLDASGGWGRLRAGAFYWPAAPPAPSPQ